MKLRPFEIGLIGFFGIMAIVAIFVLKTYKAGTDVAQQTYGDSVMIWGTFDAGLMDQVFQNITQEDKAFSVVSYKRIDPATFDSDFVNAIAEGRSPDMIILSSDDLVKHRAKLLAVPYANMPIRSFRDTYVDGAEIFALQDGVYAVPFAVDPLILYWNRDIFASNGLAQAPTTWETVVASVVPQTTVLNARRDIVQSGIAFGEFRNVRRAKDMLLTLALQSGSKSVFENERGYVVSLNESLGDTNARLPLEAATQFFTDFSNPNSSLYTWNRSLPEDANAFISGDLALYFGRGSEAQSIDSKNPNLNFDVAMMPQGGSATARRVYGSFYGFAIPRATKNASGAYNAALTLANAKFSNELSTTFDMAPVRRDLVAAGSDNPYRAIMLQSALIARGWLDPDPVASNGIFQRMVEDVISNRSRLSSAVQDAVSRLVLEY